MWDGKRLEINGKDLTDCVIKILEILEIGGAHDCIENALDAEYVATVDQDY